MRRRRWPHRQPLGQAFPVPRLGAVRSETPTPTGPLPAELTADSSPAVSMPSYPLATQRLQQLGDADLTDANVEAATRLGRPLKVCDVKPSRFRDEVAKRIGAFNEQVGLPAEVRGTPREVQPALISGPRRDRFKSRDPHPMQVAAASRNSENPVPYPVFSLPR